MPPFSFCFYAKDDENLPIAHKDLGSIGIGINYTLVVVGAASDQMLQKYIKNNGVSSKIRTFYHYKLIGNFGILSYLFKKVEGKDNERAIKEVVVEAVTIELAAQVGAAIGSRLLAGAATGAILGSTTAPIVGTIIGAVAGALIADVINDAIFADEDTQLKKDKAYNEAIDKQVKECERKINAINDYLTRHHYIERRVLNEQEAKMLCKEASDLQSHYLNTIILMLSYKDYLGQDILESRVSESTLTQSNAKSLKTILHTPPKQILNP